MREPHWSKEGKGVYFLYDDQGNTKIAYATLAKEGKTVAANVGGHPISVRAGAAEWPSGAGRVRP